LLFNPLQWWRFITGPFIFSSIGELFFGMILLYVFRLFERLWGTQKFSVRITLIFPTSNTFRYLQDLRLF
jgi:membrane associated rhomboid family serine protease